MWGAVWRRTATCRVTPRRYVASNKAITHSVAVCIIGTGQAGLSAAYYLHVSEGVPLEEIVLVDSNAQAGGSWQHYYDSLTLFSPLDYSSLPGFQMLPSHSSYLYKDQDCYPSKSDIIEHLRQYEQMFKFNVVRPFRVSNVIPLDSCETRMTLDHHKKWKCVYQVDIKGSLNGEARETSIYCRHVVNCTGIFSNRRFPKIYHDESLNRFKGLQLHSADYQKPSQLQSARSICILGGGM